MPMSYVVMERGITGGAANTELARTLGITVANQNPVKITGLFGAILGSGAGGGSLRLCNFAVIGTAGGAFTPVKKDTNNTAASQSTWSTAPTTGSGARIDYALAGIAQTGGMGGWIAILPDQAVSIPPGGGAKGNVQMQAITNGASQLIDYAIEFNE